MDSEQCGGTDQSPAGPGDLPLAHTANPATVLTWLRLMRFPTVFTAMSNILCGYCVTHVVTVSQLAAATDLYLLLLASAGLYLGGMVLNDVCDVGTDLLERPERAIPSGRISRKAAGLLAGFLLTGGVIAAACVGTPSLAIAILLCLSVIAYDAVLKKTPAGPFGMAGCRFLNVLLGASAIGDGDLSQLLHLPHSGIAAGLFVYIVGVTLFAKNEAGRSSSWALLVALSLLVAGIGIDAAVIWNSDFPDRSQLGASLALGLIGFNLVLRGRSAVRNPNPGVVQRTVGFMLLSIIFLDATVVFASSGNAALAALVVILVIPATLLKRLIPLS